MSEQNFEGFATRECGDHRTVGHRAWCYSCTTWCYPEIPCPGCEVPALEARLAEAEARLVAIEGEAKMIRRTPEVER